MYILECCDGSYHVGSTTDLEFEGTNHTRKRLPVKLVYYEKFDKTSARMEQKEKTCLMDIFHA